MTIPLLSATRLLLSGLLLFFVGAPFESAFQIGLMVAVLIGLVLFQVLVTARASL